MNNAPDPFIRSSEIVITWRESLEARKIGTRAVVAYGTNTSTDVSYFDSAGLNIWSCRLAGDYS